jgi:U3 small nucleolar RNA-associated protein 12
MLKTHHKQIVASKTMRAMLDGIRTNLREGLTRQKDEMGYNIAALKVVGMQLAESSIKGFVDEKWDEDREKEEREGVKKRAFVHVS